MEEAPRKVKRLVKFICQTLFSDTMNAIDSCIEKYPFLLMLGINFLASLCAPIHGYKGDRESARYSEQLHITAEEHVVLLNNSYYSLICI